VQGRVPGAAASGRGRRLRRGGSSRRPGGRRNPGPAVARSGRDRADLLAGRGGDVVDAGTPSAIAPASREVIGASGRGIGRLQVSVTTARAYTRLVQRVEHPAVVLRDGKLVASALPRVAAPLPEHGEVKVGGHSYRIATFTAPDFNDSTVRVAVLSDLAGAGSATSSGRLLAVIVLAGFLVLAFAFAATPSTCTNWCSAKRLPTSSPGSPTTGASTRSSARR
jgi:hypothetical protein